MQIAFRSLCAVALVLAGCGSAGIAPRSTTATIDGTVLNAGTQALLVEVPGTALGTTTDAAGAFTLSGVPEGTSFLRFRGGSLDATLAIQSVVGSEYRTVRIDASGGQLKELHDQTESEFRGKIESIDGHTLKVAGRAVTVTDATVIRRDGNPVGFDALKAGLLVEVKGALQADGTVLAHAIHIEDGEHRDDGLLIAGLITAVEPPKVFVGGLPLTTDDATEIYRGETRIRAADLHVGEKAAVRAEVRTDGTIYARRIQVYPPPGSEGFHVVGQISGVFPDVPKFTIGNDLRVYVDADTKYGGAGEPHALTDFNVGDHVDAFVVKRADGTLLAKGVMRFVPPPPPSEFEVRGLIEAIGDHVVAIAGHRLQVTDQTVIYRGEMKITLADLKVGEAAAAKAFKAADGTLVARGIFVAPPPSNEIQVKGAIEALGTDGLAVMGHRFAVDAKTEIRRGDTIVPLSNLKVGEVAEVRGVKTPEGRLLATRIRVESSG